MTQRVLLLCASIVLGSCIGFSATNEKAIAKGVWQQCSKHSHSLFSTNVPFASFYSSACPRYELGFKENGHVFCTFMFDGYPGYWHIPNGKKRGILVSVDACISVLYDMGTDRIRSINNGLLLEYLKPDTTGTNSHSMAWVDKSMPYERIGIKEADTIPSLSIAEAAERAKQYLDILGIALPANHVLYSARFNSDQGMSPLSWALTWGPSDSTCRYDESPVSCAVGFHEKLGLLYARSMRSISRPSSEEVKITREQAIFKAEKAAPIVMQTPFYRQCRLPGFNVKGVRSAELLISRPNWLLDPERAIWAREPPTEETRLCWVVVFETVDTVRERPRSFKPIPPDIRIYIDAATGEIVGANFT
jgi:hypothetical protein